MASRPSVPQVGVEALLIVAEADGVAPSLILRPPPPPASFSLPTVDAGFSARLGSSTTHVPEYLVNVPDGFSRLVLEHKVRPSASLAAVFLTSLRPEATVSNYRQGRRQR